MPALITHHLFGENAVAKLPEGIVNGQEELLAFLLGNQGPDPLFARFRTLPQKMAFCHQLADDMHQRRTLATFECLRDSVSRLCEADKNVGRAFALGMVGHYILDSTSHPMIYAQQHALCDAGVGLENAQTEVHAVIESDIDVWMLWQERHVTVLESPASADLVRTDRISRVGGALFSQVASQVYGVALGADEYGRSVADYQRMYYLLDPAGRRMQRVATRVERLFRPHSQLQAMAHHVVESDECASANLNHRTWVDPATQVRRCESFADLFNDALDKWPRVAEAVVRGDVSGFRALSGDLNYNGMPDQEPTATMAAC